MPRRDPTANIAVNRVVRNQLRKEGSAVSSPSAMRSLFNRLVNTFVDGYTKAQEDYLFAVTTQDLARALEQAAGDEQLSKRVRQEFVNLQNNMVTEALNGRDLRNANRALAKRIREETYREYKERVLYGGTYRQSYRRGSPNREAGKMVKMLRKTGTVYATRDGVAMFDQNVMAAEAKHWHRLNYGAPSSSGKPPRATQPKPGFALGFKSGGRNYFQTLNTSPLRYTSGGQGEPFDVPGVVKRSAHWYHFDDDGRFFFGYGGRTANNNWRGFSYPTRGVGARYFIEGGIAAGLSYFGEIYGDLPREWFLKARKRS